MENIFNKHLKKAVLMKNNSIWVYNMSWGGGGIFVTSLRGG